MSSDELQRASCTSTTRSGTACRSTSIIGDTGKCFAHQPKKTREKHGFSGAQQGAGRPCKPKAPDLTRTLLEQYPEIVLRPFFCALGYDVHISETGEPSLVEREGGAMKLHATSQRDGQVNLSPHDDLAGMMAASEKLLNRVYGRPTVQAELTSKEEAPARVEHGIDLKLLTDEELKILAAISKKASKASLELVA